MLVVILAVVVLFGGGMAGMCGLRGIEPATLVMMRALVVVATGTGGEADEELEQLDVGNVVGVHWIGVLHGACRLLINHLITN